MERRSGSIWTMYEQMEVVNKSWLAPGYKSSDLPVLPFRFQLYAMSWSGTLEDLADERVMIVVA